jgi:hypothetical protein
MAIERKGSHCIEVGLWSEPHKLDRKLRGDKL